MAEGMASCRTRPLSVGSTPALAIVPERSVTRMRLVVTKRQLATCRVLSGPHSSPPEVAQVAATYPAGETRRPEFALIGNPYAVTTVSNQ